MVDFGLFIWPSLLVATLPHSKRKKSRRGQIPSGIQPRRLTRQRGPRHCRVTLRLVIRRRQTDRFLEAHFKITWAPGFGSVKLGTKNSKLGCYRVPRCLDADERDREKRSQLGGSGSVLRLGRA
jgi:hypothetical protein